MSKELPSIDITTSPEILRLAEEVQRSGVGRLLKRGDQEVAVLTPAEPRRRAQRARRRAQPIDRTDPLFNIVGMISTDESTDVAVHAALAAAGLLGSPGDDADLTTDPAEIEAMEREDEAWLLATFTSPLGLSEAVIQDRD